MRFTVVVLPLDPVMPIIGFLVYQLANSISLITKIPISLAFKTKSKSDGTPGESTQRLESKTFSECSPISNSMFLLISLFFVMSSIFLVFNSLKKTFLPFLAAKRAAEIPVSPLPMIVILFELIF